MIIATIFFILIFSVEKCTTDFPFLSKIKRLISRETEDENLKGSFKTVKYLGSVVKIFCFGKKYPAQRMGRFYWYHLGKRISNSSHYSADKYGTLTIYGVVVEDSGTFICQSNSSSGKFVFKHDVIVVQLPSKSLHVHFVYTLRLCTRENEEFAKRFIESKVRGEVCASNNCKLSYIHGKCHFDEFGNPSLKVTVPIMLPGVPTATCNALCLRERLEITKEEVKKKIIDTVLRGPRLKIREEPKEMSISSLETEDENFCNPGFEMKGTVTRSLCIPCAPGHFLEKGYCIPCHLNQYSGKYAASECHYCFGNRVTRSRGSTTEEDCYLADPEVLIILFVVFIIILPIIIVCCCWGFTAFFGDSVLVKCLDAICLFLSCNCKLFGKKKLSQHNLEETQRSSNKTYGAVYNSKTLQSKKAGDSKQPSLNEVAVTHQKPTSASDSAFVIPSVRHSSGKDFFYKPQQRMSSRNIPLPPPSMPYHVKASGDASSSLKNNKLGSNREQSKNTKVKSTNDGYGLLPRFSDRILKNPPMYNAIMKTKM